MFSSLDVGCGVKLYGEVNCDLYVVDVGHRLDGSVIFAKGKNFVLCDALHLPFRDNVFGVVFCFQLIEHVSNPLLLVSELLRVSSGDVVLRFPHFLCELFNRHRSKWHRWLFTRKWFVRHYNVFSSRICDVVFPFKIPFVCLPVSVEVIIKKV